MVCAWVNIFMFGNSCCPDQALLGFSLLRTGFGLNVPILFLVFVTSPPWGPGPQGEGYIDSG